MCAEASHILSDKSDTIQMLMDCPKVITIWSLLWHSFLPTGGCGLSQQKEIYKPKGAMCNQNKADKDWIALELATNYGKPLRKYLVSYHH